MRKFSEILSSVWKRDLPMEPASVPEPERVEHAELLKREAHDGKAPILVEATTWQQQHEELWQMLVPSSGAAATMQGEVIRISGRISNELEGNGGANWDSDYSAMADAFVALIQKGKALPVVLMMEAANIAVAIKRQKAGNSDRLAELAVRWVLANPDPINLPPPPYRR